jgi:hypothetical protein
MTRRKKTTIEKWLSFNRYKRRFNAGKLASSINKNFIQQKNTIVSGDSLTYTHGSAHSLEEHFTALEREFIGSSQLCFTHAKIIVFIRREYQLKDNFLTFESMWHQEKAHLLQSLNSRWLVAAADTFADHSTDKRTQALALTCACLINTIKAQETERFISRCDNTSDDPERIRHLSEKRHALFDGTTALAVGTDDTLRNMRWRIDKIAKHDIAGDIFLELFNRVNEHDTVYKRLKERHHRDRTRWWS